MELLPIFKVLKWKNQFIKEGENERIAEYHAIQRCYESGDLTDREVDILFNDLKERYNNGI